MLLLMERGLPWLWLVASVLLAAAVGAWLVSDPVDAHVRTIIREALR